MAISLQGSSTSTGLSTTPSLIAPSGGVSGDLMIVMVTHNNGTSTVVDNNGATPCSEDIDTGNDAGGQGQAIYSRVLGASEPGTYNFTLSSSERWVTIGFTVTGWDGSTKYDLAPATPANFETTTSAPTCPGGTTVTNNAWVIATAQTDGVGNGTFTAGPTGYTEILRQAGTQPAAVYYIDQATAGTTGDADFTISVAGNNMAQRLFAIKPAVAGGQTFFGFRTLTGVGI